jgi:hypothetical protein
VDQDRHVERAVPRAREQAVTLVRRASVAAVLAALALACASKNAGQPRDPAGVAPPATATTGTLVELEPGARVVFALSDVHGGYDRLAALLAAAGLARPAPPSAGAITWSGGDAILVVAGDLIDKGPQPIEVIDALRALEASAVAAGGRVIVLLGNHEAEFFVNPTNAKADGSDGVDRELATLQIDPGVLAAGTEPRGAWLLARPFGARIGRWFFAHGGSTRGRTVAALDGALRAALAAHPTFDADEIVGGDSILEARDWYADPAVTVANAAALGVDHIVFGHDPNALGARGAIAVAQDTRLLRIDCGMSPTVNDSEGRVLRIRREGAVEIAEELGVASARELFRSAR